MLSLIELIQRSSEKDTNSSDASLTLSNKREDDDSLLSLVKNENKTILDLKKQQQVETVVKPRKPRQDKNLKLLQASSNENSHLNFSIMSNSNTCDSSSAITGAGGSLSSVSEPSRSSSSIDTGSCNTDELLLAGNSSHLDSPLNQNDLNDLSCSSRRSSFSNNDIGLDVELEQIMINNLDYLPRNNTEANTCNQADQDSLSPKLKSKQYNNNNATNNKKQNKQPSYCNRNRRSRIVRTPLPPQPTFDTPDIDKIVDFENSNEIGDQNFTAACNNQNSQICSNDKDVHDESSRVLLNDYIIANNNDLEETKKCSSFTISNSKQFSSTNMPHYQYDQSNTTNNSNNQNPLLNEINRRRKKWLVSNSENITNKNNENSTCSSSSNSSSGNELSVSPTQSKTKHLQKNINQKIQQLQNHQQLSQPQTQQQQTDYPVFKYLSKSLMNNLFTKENPNSNHLTSVCNSNLENSKPAKLNKKPLNNTQNSELQAASTFENSNKSDINSTTSSITAANNSVSSLKKHSTSNYNYLINKYSTLTSSTSSLNGATTPTPTSTHQLKTSLKHNENHKDQDFNPIIIDIIKDLISDVIDSLEKKKPNNNLTNTTKHLNNKTFKTEIEIINKHHEASFCAAKNINYETTIDTEKNLNIPTVITSSNFKLNNCNIKPAPLIKTLINDITQLNKINSSNNTKSRIYNNALDQIKNSSSPFTAPNNNEIGNSIDLVKYNNPLKYNVQNEEDAYLDSDTAEEVANLADNSLLININYETEHSEVAANNINNLNKETKSIRKSNNNQICDETYEKNYNKIITNQKSTNEEIIIVKTNANNNNFNDSFMINQAFVYASKKSNNSINENNIKVINNNIDDCCNNNKNNKENAIIYDTNDFNNYNNYNNNNNDDINYAKLNNYKEYAKVEVNSKEDNNECSSLLHVKNNTTNNISNDLKLLNIKTPKELLKITNNNNNNTKPSDNNLKDITLYPPYESSSTTKTTKTKSKILLQNKYNTNNLDENNLSIIEKNSDMTDLEEEEEENNNNKATNNNNSKKTTNAKQTDFIKSGQTNANVLSSNQNNADFPLSTVHLNKNQKQDEVKNDYCDDDDDDDDEKIPNEPPPPPPPLLPPPPLISSSSPSENKYDAQLFISNSTESNPAIATTTTEMTTPKENCEIVLEKNFCENNFIKIEDTYKKENKNNYNRHNKEANEEKEENKFSINSNNFSNINIINNEEKLNNNNLIDDKNCNYSEQNLLLNNNNNNNNNINEDLLDKKISLVEEDKKNPEEKKEIKNSNINNSYNKVGEHYNADETVRLEKEKLLENKEIDLIKLKKEEPKEVEGLEEGEEEEKEEEEEGKKGFMFAISSNEQNDKLVNKSNNEKNANSNEDEVGLLLNNNKNNNNKECKNKSNENEKKSNNSNNSNNEIASNLELFSKQEETKNNTTYITINSNNNNNNNNVENNDSMNSLNHIETMKENKTGIEEETNQKEQEEQKHKKSSTNNNNNQLREQETNANNEPDMKTSNNSNEANIILNKSAHSDVDVDAAAAAALSTEIVESVTTEKKEEIFKASQLIQMNDNLNLENNQNENEDRRLDVSKNDETYPVKQTAEINETNEFEYLGHNVTKVTFKSKEIALIEDCEDEDEKELDRIIKSKSINTFDLFYNPNASTPATRKKASDLFASKSSTFFSTSLTSERKHRSAKTDHSNSSNDDDDDPYVKAALERFDAFCRSKSSHSLDKTSSSATISTANVNPGSSISSASNTSAQHLNRNKSPFLTRKTITNPDDEPSLRENIGSFIKRRQARVDPSLNNAANNSQSDTNNTKAETISNFTGSTPEIEQVISSMPPIANKILNRSCSETRTIDEKPNTKLTASPMPLSSSSLAKRFLGSLTPQLEPTLEAAVNLDIDEKCYENTISNTINTAPNIKASENSIEITPDIPEFKPTEADERKEPATIKSEVIIAPKRKQITQTRPSSAGAELNSHHHHNNSNSNSINRSINSRHSKETTNEKSPPENDKKEIILSPATKPKQTNIIKLELVNNLSKSKLRNDEKSASPPLDKTNLKPPLPPSIPPATVQTVTSLVSLQPSSSSSSSSSTHSSSWRSKLKSIYNEAPIIDGNNKNSTTQLNSPPVSSSNEVSTSQKSASSNKPTSRIIPLEVKNQKTGTVTIVKPNSNSNSNSRSNSMSMSSNSSSSTAASNKKETNFNITPPVSATSLQKNGFLSSSNSGPNDRVRSSSSYRASSTSEPTGSQQQQSASSLRNSSSFTYRDLSPSKQNSNSSSRALSSSSFHADSRLRNQQSADESTPTPSENLNESPDPIAEKACNNFMHKLMEMQRQYKPTYVSSSSSIMPTSMSSSFTEQTTTPISSSRTTNLYNDVYKNRSNENIFASSTSTPTPTSTPAPATPLNSYPYSSHLYNSTYSSGLSVALPAAGVLDSLLSNNNGISSSSSSSLLNSENSASSVALGIEPIRPYVSAIRKRRTLFSDENNSNDSSAADSNMASTVSYFTNKNFTSPYVNEYKSPYSSLLSSASLNKSNGYTNASKHADTVNVIPNNSQTTAGRNRPLSIVSEESNTNNNALVNLTRSLSAKDSRSTNNETNNFKDDNMSTSLMISNTPSQKLKHTTQLKKSNSINSTTTSRSDADNSVASNSSQQKLRSTVFDRLAALNSSNSNNNSTVSNKSNEINNSKAAPTSTNRLTTQKSNSNSCWQLNISSPNQNLKETETSQQIQQQQRRNSIDKTIGDLTQKNMTTIIKDQNEIAIVTSVVPAKRVSSSSSSSSNCNNSENSSASSSSSSSSLSRIRSLDSKSREKLRSNKDLKKSNVNLSLSTTSNNNHQQTLPPSGSSNSNYSSKPTKSENEGGSSRRKSSISNGVSLTINNNCFNSSSNPSFSSTKPADNCLSKKDVFERLSKRTNSMKNLAASLNNKATRSTGSPSSDRENDGNLSPQTSSDEHPTANSISKTSVFERLYKSNIAAHMNHQASMLNDNQTVSSQSNVNNLKKNMSLSSANLNGGTPTTIKKLNTPPTTTTTVTNKTQQRELKNKNGKNQKQEDSETDEIYRHFSNVKNYDGDDSNDDRPLADFQSQQFVF